MLYKYSILFIFNNKAINLQDWQLISHLSYFIKFIYDIMERLLLYSQIY